MLLRWSKASCATDDIGGHEAHNAWHTTLILLCKQQYAAPGHASFSINSLNSPESRHEVLLRWGVASGAADDVRRHEARYT